MASPGSTSMICICKLAMRAPLLDCRELRCFVVEWRLLRRMGGFLAAMLVVCGEGVICEC